MAIKRLKQTLSNNRGTGWFLKKLFPYFKLEYRTTLIVLGLFIFGIAYELFIPVVVQLMVDKLTANAPLSSLLFLIGIIFLVSLFYFSGVIIKTYYQADLCQKIISNIQNKLYLKLQRLSLYKLLSKKSTEILEYFTTDLFLVEVALSRSIPNFFKAFFGFFLGFCLLFWFSWILTLLLLLFFPLAYLIPQPFIKRANQYTAKRQKAHVALSHIIEESIILYLIIKIFQLENYQYRTFKNNQKKQSKLSLKSNYYNITTGQVTNFSFEFIILFIISIGVLLVSFKWITLGALMGFMMLTMYMGESIAKGSESLSYIIQGSISMQRITQFLNLKDEGTESKGTTPLRTFKDQIEFKHVKFSYENSDANDLILEDINLHIKKNQMVALVGTSGSGKSTVLNLLIRLYSPLSGKILIDGKPLSSVSLKKYRNLIGVVPQDPEFFERSIKENITIGKHNATQTEIENAAKAASIHDTILSLPDAYNTLVGKRGSSLSGGQRQRIAIARALIKNPEILLLDEITSALDPHTANKINETIIALTKKRTIIYVTHHLGHTIHADNIYVFHKGKIIESGSHQELLNKNQLYADMWRKQSNIKISKDGTDIQITPDYLRTIPIFHDVNTQKLERLSHLFSIKRISADTYLMNKGEPGDRFYVIANGTIEIRSDSTPSSKLIDTLKDGDFIGELSLISDIPRTASGLVVKDSILLSLNKNDFMTFLDQYPKLKKEILSLAKKRMEKLKHN